MPGSKEEYAPKAEVEHLSALIEALTEKMGRAMAELSNSQDRARALQPDKIVEEVTEKVTAYVQAHPMRAALIAFPLGVLISARRHH